MDARKQLGIEDRDVALIRSKKNSNWLFLGLLGAVTGVVAFVIGFLISRENPGYPYSSLGPVVVTAVGRNKAPWVAALLLALIAIFSVNLGVFAARPTMGEMSFYGVSSRKT